MESNFYNKVAKKFGSYHTGSRYQSVYPEEDPEKVFREKIINNSGKKLTALDLGSGDGRFIFSISPNFKEIIGIDTSAGMLKAAKKLQKELGIKNVKLYKQDAFHTNFKNQSFDLIYSRRGPTPFNEVFRLLKPGGLFIVIEIGEKDCVQIKKIFKRGQGYKKWNQSVTEKVKNKAQQIGFKVQFIKDYKYHEYYPNIQEFDLFLQGVPIFEDYDTQKDKKYLEAYFKKFTTKQGIQLERHRVVFVLHKP